MGPPREQLAAASKERSRSDAQAPPAPMSSEQGPVLEGLGNRALLSLLRSGRLQAKPNTNSPATPGEDASQATVWSPVAATAVPLGELGQSWSIQAEGMAILMIEGFQIPQPKVIAAESDGTLRIRVWVAVDPTGYSVTGQGRWTKVESMITGPMKPAPPAPKPPPKPAPKTVPKTTPQPTPGPEPVEPQLQPPEPQPEPVPLRPTPTTPNARIAEAADKNLPKAVEIASQLSDFELAELMPDTRLSLLRAIAAQGKSPSAETLMRTLATTPKEDAADILDGLRDDPMLLPRLRASLPSDAGMQFEFLLMDLSARSHGNPSLPLEALTPTAPAPFDLSAALKGAPRDPRDVVWLGNPLLRPDWTRGLKLWKDAQGNTQLWTPEMGVTSWDPEGKRLGPLPHPDADKISRALRTSSELARTGGQRYVPGKGWLDEGGWQAHLVAERQSAMADAGRKLEYLSGGVEAWNETQGGFAYLASGPSHLLGGRSFSDPQKILAGARQDVAIALRELENARTPAELAEAKRHLASATRRGEHGFTEYKEDVFTGGEHTITGIKVAAVAATAYYSAPVLFTYAGGGAAAGFGTNLFATGVSAGGSSLLTGTMGGVLESTHHGFTWENYGKGFVEHAPAGLGAGLGHGGSILLGVGAGTTLTLSNLPRVMAVHGGSNMLAEMYGAGLRGQSWNQAFAAGGRGLFMGSLTGPLGMWGGNRFAGSPWANRLFQTGLGGGGGALGTFIAGGSAEDMWVSGLIGASTALGTSVLPHAPQAGPGGGRRPPVLVEEDDFLFTAENEKSGGKPSPGEASKKGPPEPITLTQSPPEEIEAARALAQAAVDRSAQVPLSSDPTVLPRSLVTRVLPPGTTAEQISTPKGLTEAFGPGQCTTAAAVLTLRMLGAPGAVALPGTFRPITRSSGVLEWLYGPKYQRGTFQSLVGRAAKRPPGTLVVVGVRTAPRTTAAEPEFNHVIVGQVGPDGQLRFVHNAPYSTRGSGLGQMRVMSAAVPEDLPSMVIQEANGVSQVAELRWRFLPPDRQAEIRAMLGLK